MIPTGDTEVKVDYRELSKDSQERVKGVMEELGFSLVEISKITVMLEVMREEEEE